MRRAISILVQPRSILIFVVLLIFLIFVFSNPKKSEEKAEEVPEITHRVYLDIDIDEQHQGRIVIGLYGQVVPKTVGTVSMVNSGPDSNGSQFFITTVKASWLDGEHVVFGKVIQGMDTVFAIEGGAGTYSGKPRKKVVIVDSGEIPKSEWDQER
ncbi:peptidyl-prolyl cis-trans isomerase CYP21-1 [Fagus crenata]